MQCLLTVLSKSDSDKTQAIKDCGNDAKLKNVASHELSVTYPSPVPKQGRTCSGETDVAGTTHYEQAQYTILPSNARAKLCTAQCCPKCDSFSCPAPQYVKKSSASSIFGNKLGLCCDLAMCNILTCPNLWKPKPSSSSIRGYTTDSCCDMMMCSTFSCPSPYQLKSGAGSIQGDSKDVCCDQAVFPGTVLLTSSDIQFLKGSGISPTQWMLCYRRSTHGARSYTFHSLCDGKGESVTVVKFDKGEKDWRLCLGIVDSFHA